MNSNKIIVIIPVYNVENYLECCLDSVLSQTYKNFEVLLVDDGSTDRSSKICDDYAEKYAKIKVIHQNNEGISSARNAGIQYVRQNEKIDDIWISFIDSDDFVHPLYLECLYGGKASNVDIVSCGFVRKSLFEIDVIDKDDIKYEIISTEEYWYRKKTNATVVWGKLYKFNCFDNIKYPLEKIFEDEFTSYKILFKYEKIAVIWTPLYYWRLNLSSITQREWTPNRMDVMEALQEQMDFFREHGHSMAYRQSLLSLYTHNIRQLAYVKALSPKYDDWLNVLKKGQKRVNDLMIKEFGVIKTSQYWFDGRIWRPLKRIIQKKTLVSSVKRRIQKIILRVC